MCVLLSCLKVRGEGVRLRMEVRIKVEGETVNNAGRPISNRTGLRQLVERE